MRWTDRGRLAAEAALLLFVGGLLGGALWLEVLHDGGRFVLLTVEERDAERAAAYQWHADAQACRY